MKNTGVFALKVAAVWLALLAGQVIGGMIGMALSHMVVAPAKPDGGLPFMPALLLMTGLFAVVLSALASRLRWDFKGRLATLFVVFYGLVSVLSEIEAIYFSNYFPLPKGFEVMIAVSNAGLALAGSAAAAALWAPAFPSSAPKLGGLFWKIPLILPLYVAIYFGAGALIAWQGAAVRAFYDNGTHINTGELALLQLGRGLIWALLGLLIVKSVRGSKILIASYTGAAFAILMAVTLLLPNALMPWDVRKFHLMEILTSNFIFGVLVALILLIGAKVSLPDADRP